MNGIILAGGQSLRFGEDKAFVKVRDSILIESLISLMTSLFDNLIIVTNYPDKYSGYQVQLIRDKIKGVGPLGGIYAGLLASDAEFNFITACDMPFINAELVKYMKKTARSDVLVPSHAGKLEPLCAVYSKNCIPLIERQLRAGDYKIQNFFPEAEVEMVDEETIKKYDPAKATFLNLNTKKDLARVDACLKKHRSYASS
ncbi:molybdenum cofactor guanylyltransferase [Candidatus Margulisiibacteriota bacterium]